MKKILFTVLVAVVAVGGAYAQQVYTPDEFGLGQIFICDVNEAPTCQMVFPGGAYEYPSGTYVQIFPADRLYEEL